jgi:hypothetical protein
MVAGTLMGQRNNKMNYLMFDNLRILSEVVTASVVVLGLGSLLVCFKLFVASLPVNVQRSASIASA